MPILRFNRAINIARDLKVFLNLQSGLTRGVVPDAGQHNDGAETLRSIRQLIREQREKIKQQAESLGYARQYTKRQKAELNSKEREIFRLKNELRAAKERMESATNGRPAAQVAVESKTDALPDFVIIGAIKCGTTFLYDLLTRHPHVERAALKELHYFNNNFKEGIEWYRSQFPPPRWKDGRRSITGEATPHYLFRPLVPERMAKVVPQARLIVLLRNPIDRAYSHYYNWVRIAGETRTFEKAIEAEMAWLLSKEDGARENERRASIDHPRLEYLSRGIYVDQLLRWSKFFSKEQMLVLKSEDFYERTLDTLKLVLDFLDLPDWQPEPWALTKKSKNKYPRMNPATRQRLEAYFEPHNRRLYEYLGVDLGW